MIQLEIFCIKLLHIIAATQKKEKRLSYDESRTGNPARRDVVRYHKCDRRDACRTLNVGQAILPVDRYDCLSYIRARTKNGVRRHMPTHPACSRNHVSGTANQRVNKIFTYNGSVIARKKKVAVGGRGKVNSAGERRSDAGVVTTSSTGGS